MSEPSLCLIMPEAKGDSTSVKHRGEKSLKTSIIKPSFKKLLMFPRLICSNHSVVISNQVLITVIVLYAMTEHIQCVIVPNV